MAVTSSKRARVTLPTDEQILIEREFDAPKDLVYQAYTTPDLVKRWWHANRGEVTLVEMTPVCRSTDWRQPVVVPDDSENGRPPSLGHDPVGFQVAKPGPPAGRPGRRCGHDRARGRQAGPRHRLG